WSVLRSITVGRTKIAAVQHRIKSFFFRQPLEGNSGRRMLVESYKRAVTELLGPANIPGNVLGPDSVKLPEKRAEPERRRHGIIRHAYALAPEVLDALDSRFAIHVQP